MMRKADGMCNVVFTDRVPATAITLLASRTLRHLAIEVAESR